MSEVARYRNRHYTDWVEPIGELKRAGELDEALVVIYGCMDAVEAEAALEGWQPAPWFYEQAAIVHRKRADYDAEVAVLERYLRVCGPLRPKRELADRLSKARELVARSRSRFEG